jgi:two-component system, LytTR family, sensor kinase
MPSATNRLLPFEAVPTPEEPALGKRTPADTGAMFRPLRLWLFVCAICLAVGLAESAQAYWLLPLEEGGQVLGGWRSLGLGVGVWGTWALLWPIAHFMAHRFPLGPRHWRGRLPLLLAAGLACVLLKIVFDYPVIYYCYCPTPEVWTFPKFMLTAFAGYSLRYLTLFWAMIGVVHALDFYNKYRDSQLREAHLETGLTRARLQLLKTQLHPHFLFNTLNALSALIYTDVDAAERMLARLGDLLRLSLEDFGVQEAPLARELEVIRYYLDIEQARLGPRLRVEWKVAPEVTEALVPTFLLQPLIENAIRHGISPRSEPGRIEVRAWRRGGELCLEVRDDGPGLRAEQKPGSGVGLTNTRARLLHLYGDAQRFEIGNDVRGGCVARVVLPFYEPVGISDDSFRGRDDTHVDCR